MQMERRRFCDRFWRQFRKRELAYSGLKISKNGEFKI